MFKWHFSFQGRVVSRNWTYLRTISCIMPLFVTNVTSDGWWISRFERTRFPYLDQIDVKLIHLLYELPHHHLQIHGQFLHPWHQHWCWYWHENWCRCRNGSRCVVLQNAKIVAFQKKFLPLCNCLGFFKCFHSFIYNLSMNFLSEIHHIISYNQNIHPIQDWCIGSYTFNL